MTEINVTSKGLKDSGVMIPIVFLLISPVWALKKLARFWRMTVEYYIDSVNWVTAPVVAVVPDTVSWLEEQVSVTSIKWYGTNNIVSAFSIPLRKYDQK